MIKKPSTSPQSARPEDDKGMLSPSGPRKRGPGLEVLTRLRNSFIAGLVVIAPVGMTVWLFWTVTGWVDGVVLPLVPDRIAPENYIGINIRGIGLILLLAFTLLVGWLTKGLIGRSFVRWGEWVVCRMPIIRSVYRALKQIVETVFAQSESSFEKACLIEYPRKGAWAVGFVSATTRGEVHRRTLGQGRMLSVFLPTTPNPTSGFLLFVPEEDVILLEMSVKDAAKLVISAGLVIPEDPGRQPDKDSVARSRVDPGS